MDGTLIKTKIDEHLSHYGEMPGVTSPTRVYLCGPMSGLPFLNIPNFNDATYWLRNKGYDVVSPAELDDRDYRDACLKCVSGSPEELTKICEEMGVESPSWNELLMRDLKIIGENIQKLVVLSGWTKSRGARLETFMARMYRIPIVKYPELESVTGDELNVAHGFETRNDPFC